MEKDWSERFERTQAKPRIGRVVLGAFILIARVGHILMIPGGFAQRLDLWPPNNGEAVGYDLAGLTMWILAVWLIVSGLKPR